MDYAETLFEAVDVLVDKKIESVKFDETITATIVDASDAKSGKYLVSNGSAKFVAYSTVTNYRERDSVLVTIPQGNYDNQKIIVSKVLENENAPLVYTSPFERIINLTSNVIAGAENDSYNIWANDNKDYNWANNQSITEYIASLDDENRESPLPYLHMEHLAIQGYTALGLRAQFSTHLLDYDTVSGNYGIIAKLVFNDGSVAEYLTFDCDEFFGNPYNYDTYFTLSKVFDITNYENQVLTDIYLYPYQRNNFVDVDGERIPGPDDNSIFFKTVPANIFIKDPYVCFGTFVEQFNGDTAQLFTSDLNYNTDDENLIRHMTLQWIHQDDASGQVAVVENATVPDGYQIRWYRYHFGSPSPDNFVEAHWDRLETHFEYVEATSFSETESYYTLENETYSLVENLTEAAFNTAIQNEGKFYIKHYDTVVNNINATITLDSSLATEQFKVVIVKAITEDSFAFVAASNIITFSNLDEIVNPPINYDLFYIQFNDDEKGNYFIYDESGEVGKNEDAEQRELEAYFDGIKLSESGHSFLPSDLVWTFPAENTMVIGIGTGNNNTSTGTTAHFAIKRHLDHNASNNTIKLTGIIDGIEYQTSAELRFGSAGDNGSDYKIILTWRNRKNAYDVNSKNNLIGDITLQDRAGDTVPIPAEAVLSYSWKVAYVEGESQQEKEVETRDVFYPVFTTSGTPRYDDFAPLLKGLSNNPNASDQPSGFYYFLDSSDKSLDINYPDYCYYIFDPQQGIFTNVLGKDSLNRDIYVDFEDNTIGNIYRKAIDGERKNKLTFVPITFSQDPLDHESGNVTTVTNAITVSNGKKVYKYSTKQRYYIKFEDQYILDPWDTYQETETYYEPYEASPSSYSTSEAELTAAAGDVWSQSHSETLEPRTAVVVYQEDKENDISMDSLYILEITLSNFGDYDLHACFPVPLEDSSVINPMYIEGPSRVRYSSSGETAFNKNPYQIMARIGEDNVKGHGYTDLSNDETLAGYWKLLYTGDPGSNFKPQLNETVIDQETNKPKEPTNGNEYDIPLLSPVSVYIPSEFPYGVQFYYNDSPVWTQPIVVEQNNYPSQTLNKWNGRDILTDEDAGTITASGFSAGKKERDNTFTGIVLGDWSRSVADPAITKTTGIYGFNHGAMSYAFKDDGTGFIGKDGSGRIYFDGNKSQIYSNQWRGNDQQGMLLDIDDGYVKMQKINPSDTQEENEFIYLGAISDIINDRVLNRTGQSEQKVETVYFRRVYGENDEINPYDNTIELLHFRFNNTFYDNTKENAISTSMYFWPFETERNVRGKMKTSQSTSWDTITEISTINFMCYFDYQPFYEIDAITSASHEKFIHFGADQTNYPLSIGRLKNISKRKFKVNWNGKIFVEDGVFNGEINAVSGTISGPLTVSGSLTGGKIKASTLIADYGIIGGWTISQLNLISADKKTRLETNAGNNYPNIITDYIQLNGTISHNNNNESVTSDIGYFKGDTTNIFGIKTKKNSIALVADRSSSGDTYSHNIALKAPYGSIYLQNNYNNSNSNYKTTLSLNNTGIELDTYNLGDNTGNGQTDNIDNGIRLKGQVFVWDYYSSNFTTLERYISAHSSGSSTPVTIDTNPLKITSLAFDDSNWNDNDNITYSSNTLYIPHKVDLGSTNNTGKHLTVYGTIEGTNIHAVNGLSIGSGSGNIIYTSEDGFNFPKKITSTGLVVNGTNVSSRIGNNGTTGSSFTVNGALSASTITSYGMITRVSTITLDTGDSQDLIIAQSTNTNDGTNTISFRVQKINSGGTDYIRRGVYQTSTIGGYPSNWLIYAAGGTNLYCGNGKTLYGGAYSDYAEVRKLNQYILPGRCVKEDGEGQLNQSANRLEKSCWIISDTYGWCINSKDTDDQDPLLAPIAVSGRVLAYPYESIEDFANHIGDPVCSGPNGTVSIMTEEEERMYPSRIIGTIASIPQEETFGDVEVNGRVWIKIL